MYIIQAMLLTFGITLLLSSIKITVSNINYKIPTLLNYTTAYIDDVKFAMYVEENCLLVWRPYSNQSLYKYKNGFYSIRPSEDVTHQLIEGGGIELDNYVNLDNIVSLSNKEDERDLQLINYLVNFLLRVNHPIN